MKKFDKLDLIVILLTGLALWYFMGPGRSTAPTNATPPAAPVAASPTEAAPKVEGPTATTPEAPAPASKPEAVLTEMSNGIVSYVFTNLGGGVKSAVIQPAPFAGKTPQELNLQSEGAIGGLARVDGELDTAVWTLGEKTDRTITYTLTTKDGVLITKKWSMVDGAKPEHGPGYLWNLQIKLKNTGTEKFIADNFFLYAGTSKQLHNNDALYVSAVYSGDGEKTEIKSGDFTESKFLGLLWQTQAARSTITKTFGHLTWGGVASQYYVTLISPQAQADGKIWARRFNDDAHQGSFGIHAGVGLPRVSLEAAQEATYDYQVFTGPRSGSLLNKLEGERNDAMFYGWTSAISKMFLGMLNFFHGWMGSFGLAIVLLTIIVRVTIWPLHIKATRSMKRMGLLAPMMNEIKLRYKDKQMTPELQRKQQMEMMGLYKEYSVSPLGGCLPLLLQMPIFFGYFGMLNHAVEMRGHSFLWAHDLTQSDTIYSITFPFSIPLIGSVIPINPLPLIMTLTMFIQMKLQPTPPSTDENQKMQMKIMKFMPLMFLAFCYGNASALALYWTVQNIVSIGQTYLVKRMPEPALTKREVRKLPPVSGRNSLGQPIEPEKPKGPTPPRPGGSGKSAFKK